MKSTLQNLIPHSQGNSVLYPRLLRDLWGHRDGLADTCPYCFRALDDREWITTPSVKEVVLNHYRFSEPGKVIVISTCPRCGHPSWCHWQAELLGLYASREPGSECYPFDVETIQIAAGAAG